MKPRYLFFLLAFAGCITASAQTSPVKIGWFNYDSLLHTIPGYTKTLDSIKQLESSPTRQLKDAKVELERKFYEYDSLFTKWSPLIRSLKEKEITDLQEYIAELQKRADNEKDDFTATSPYHLKLTEAGKKIGQQNGCVAVVNAASTDELVTWSAPGTVFVNLTAEICAELKLTSK